MEKVKILQEINWDNLTFSLTRTRSMYVAEQNDNGPWEQGKLVPFGNVSMSPAAGVLNYGQGIFEGLKAFRTSKDRIVLFRPQMNAKRIGESTRRLCIPEITEDYFLDAVRQTVNDNIDFVPPYKKGSMYIRPISFGTSPSISVGPSSDYLFMVFVSPVGPYFKGGVKPLHLIVSEQYHRAAPK
jgi:branched-chain amino acid aminotransferase